MAGAQVRGIPRAVPRSVDKPFRMRNTAGMDTSIPSSADVRQRLLPLRHAQLQALARASGVPFTTLWKVRSGETQNPGLDTARSLLAALHMIESAPSAGVCAEPPDASTPSPQDGGPYIAGCVPVQEQA
jgi:transcriptional regulator with XRE-family HTH domain